MKRPAPSSSCSIRCAARSREDALEAEQVPVVASGVDGDAGVAGAVLLAFEAGVATRGGGRVTLVAGIDSSTQSCKLEVRDADTGELVRTGQRPHSPDCPAAQRAGSGRVVDGAVVAARRARSRRRRHLGGRPAARHGRARRRAPGAPSRPSSGTTPNRRRRPMRWCDAWGAQAWADAVGTVPVASFTITKLAWLREHEPDEFARVAHVLLPHDWLTLQLSGELVTDRGDASGTGYWSPSTGCYVGDVFGLLDLDPDGRADGPRAGRRRRDPRRRDRRRRDRRQHGCRARPRPARRRRGDLTRDVGHGLRGRGLRRRVTPSGAVAGFADATGRFLPLVCTLNATKVTDAMARLLGRDRDELERLALASAPGAGGVVLLPYFDGERTPNLPGATGTFTGLRSDTEPAQLAGRVRGRRVRAARRVRRAGGCGSHDRPRSGARRRRRRPLAVYPNSSPTCCSVGRRAGACRVRGRGACVQAAAALDRTRRRGRVARSGRPPTASARS